ncbi:MAG TPA: preprotein translocase subunit YajC [Acidimicrobiales bacterium]|nr:preprotein translocase subunit YajC [Acidimicrobiales bacterium]
MNHLLPLATTLLGATTKAKSSSSSATFLIFIVVVVGELYFLFLRPNQQRAKKQRAENSSISVGDRVVSIGGIVGRIEEMQNDRVVLLTGHPGIDGDDDVQQPTRLVMLRSAIARKVDAASVPMPGLEHDEDGGDSGDDHPDGHDTEHPRKAEGDTGP